MCLAIVGAVVSAAGTAFSAAASAASYNAQSRMADRQREIERDRGAYEAGRLADQNDRALAGMRGAYLSSGIALEGSAQDVITDSATEASLDEQAIRYGSKIRQDNLRFESQMAKMNARQAVIGGALGGTGQLINGVVQGAQQSFGRTMMRNPYGGGF